MYIVDVLMYIGIHMIYPPAALSYTCMREYGLFCM